MTGLSNIQVRSNCSFSDKNLSGVAATIWSIITSSVSRVANLNGFVRHKLVAKGSTSTASHSSSLQKLNASYITVMECGGN